MASTPQEPLVDDRQPDRLGHDPEKASNGSQQETVVGEDPHIAAEKGVPPQQIDYMHKGSAFEKKLLRKIDWRLVPALSFMYGCSLIDRTNLPNARLSGLDRDLATNVGDRYSIITLIFFIPYILTEIPGNLALKKGVHPRFWLPGSTIMIGFGFVTDWTQLVGLRVLLGIFEGLLFPGCIFLISSWYPRYETQKRISYFYLGGQALSGFGNIIAYGFSTMAGQGGRPGWSWIFIMMGVLTCISALIGFALVPNFPAKASLLNEEERQLVNDRISVDRHDFEEEKLTVKLALQHLSDIKIWSMGILFLSSTLPAYAFSYFLALILRGFGYSVRDSQLLSAPPYIAAIICGMAVGYAADHLRHRGGFVILGALVSLTGSAIVGFASSNGVRYFGAFLAVIGCQSNIPTVMAWSSNNSRGAGRKAINSAIVVGGGGVGGIIASVAFRQQDAASGYRPGLWTTIAFQILICIVVVALDLHFAKQNKRAARGEIVIQGEKSFRYTL